MPTQFCISCGEPFDTSDPAVGLCPSCAGDSLPATPPRTQAGELKSSPPPPGKRLPDWQVGELILDTYEVKGGLGQGGFGKVYRVRHTSWGIDLAVKRPLKLEEAAKPVFTSEAEKWIDLGLHPNIVACYYVRNIDGFPHTFAELAEGGSLGKWIEDQRLYAGGKASALKRILDIAIQFAWGLAYAHQQGLVHQDVKPDNVLMGAGDVAMVTDFGLARARSLSSADSRLAPGGGEGSVSALGGTLAYMSPEQSAGQRLTAKTDLWSWAVSMLEMLLGERTWLSGSATPEVLEEYAAHGENDPKIYPPPVALVQLLRDCFAVQPEQRPVDLLAVAERLQEIYRQECGTTYPRQAPQAAELRADSLNNKALSFLDLGKIEQAKATWREALTIDSHHAESTYNYGLLQWRRGEDLDDLEFVAHLQAAMAAQPASPKPYDYLAQVHQERSDLPAARQVFKQAPATVAGESVSRIQAVMEKEAGARRLATLPDGMPPIALTPDGRRLVAVSATTHLGSIHPSGDAVPSYSLVVFEIPSGRKILHLPMDGVYRVNHLLLTRDGQKVIVTCAGLAFLWDLASQSKEKTFTGGRGEIRDIALSPDGRSLFVVNQFSLIYRDLSSGERYFSGSAEQARCLALSPDGHWAFVGHANGKIQSIDLSAAKVQSIVPTERQYLLGHTRDVSALAACPDGRLLISGSYDHTLRIWDLHGGRCLHELTGHSDAVMKILVTPDSQRAVSLGYDRAVRVWDLASGACLRVLTSQKQQVNALALTPDGRRAITGDSDEAVRVWDLDSGCCLRTLAGHKYDVKAVVVAPDGQYAVTAEEEQYEAEYELQLWSLAGIGQARARWALCLPSTSAEVIQAASQAETELERAAAALKAGHVKEAGKALRQMQEVPGFERDPKWLALWRQAGSQGGRTVGLLNEREIVSLKGHKEPIYAAVCSSDGSLAASAGFDCTIRIWDVRRGQALHCLEGQKPVGALAFLPGDRRLLSGANDGCLRLWDVGSGAEIRQFLGHHSIVWGVAVSADGRQALSGGADRDIRLWDLESGECIKILKGHKEFIYSLAFTPDGRSALSGGDDEDLYLWDLTRGVFERKLAGHGARINCIAVAPDGRHALTVGDDELVLYWDLRKKSLDRELTGHRGEVRAAVITPDGRFAFTAGKDATLRLWELSSGDCLRTISAHQNMVTALALSSAGDMLLSGSVDTNLKAWELTWDYNFGWGLFR